MSVTVGFLAGIAAVCLYRRAARHLLGEQTLRDRAIRSFNHDEFLKLHESVVNEHARRFPI